VQDAGDRDGQQRPQEAEQLHPEQDGDQVAPQVADQGHPQRRRAVRRAPSPGP
jgi:hypothetical protein